MGWCRAVAAALLLAACAGVAATTTESPPDAGRTADVPAPSVAVPVTESDGQSPLVSGASQSLLDLKPDLQRAAQRGLQSAVPTGLTAVAERELYAPPRPPPPPLPPRGCSWDFLKAVPGTTLLYVVFALVVIVVLVVKGRG